jgi:hypothetical protein
MSFTTEENNLTFSVQYKLPSNHFPQCVITGDHGSGVSITLFLKSFIYLQFQKDFLHIGH